MGGLIMDKEGNLYGTTWQGGNNWNGGTVFKLTPSGTLTQLYTFLSQPGDGCNPQAALIMDKMGNLYGTASYCNHAGTVFEVTPEGKEATLYSFCSDNCLDGEYPFAGVVMDKKGNLYGDHSRWH